MKVKLSIKKIVFAILWSLLGIGTISVLVAAIEKGDKTPCAGYSVQFTRINDTKFVEEADVVTILNTCNNPIQGKPIQLLDIKKMENLLLQNPWVDNANVFVDNTNILQVRISEKHPIARLFFIDGRSCYLDSQMHILPLNAKFSARLPVFTGVTPFHTDITLKDSLVMVDIKAITLYLTKNAFWLANIDQVNINEQGNYDMVSKLGDYVINFGDGADIENKFNRLEAFYRQVLQKKGWNYYSSINVGFANQIIATHKSINNQYEDSSIHPLNSIKSVSSATNTKIH
jgi:cell division protein FtsQ